MLSSIITIITNHDQVPLFIMAMEDCRMRMKPPLPLYRPMKIFPVSITLLAALFLLSVSTVSAQCDYSAVDTCPFNLDEECDAAVIIGCEDAGSADCYDCDPCTAHRLDCDACIAADCYWCPTDGTCLSQAVDTTIPGTIGNQLQAIGTLLPIIGSCTELDWSRTCPPPSNLDFTDPLYDANKWVFDLINVEQVWADGITGLGVHVKVIDSGVDATHPEFAGKFDATLSCDEYLPIIEDGVLVDHGNGVASIIGAAANNNVCSTGIAPGTTLSACLLGQDNADILRATLATNTHISSNSWGDDGCRITLPLERRSRRKLQGTCPFSSGSLPCQVCNFAAGALSEDCSLAISVYCIEGYENDPIACAEYLDLYVDCGYNAIEESAHEELVRGIMSGRDSKGIIFVFASGNEYTFGEVVNTEGWLNSRFTITVGGVGKYGKHASYSTTGAALFMTAPGGDSEFFGSTLR